MIEGLYAGALEDANLRAQTLDSAGLERLIAKMPSTIDSYKALARGANIKVLAEIKRASPSKGDLSPIEDVAALALNYANAGASAISVLTEKHGFKGSLEDLQNARAAVRVPLLRKDFISSEYQILEARAFGADMILLIVAGLEKTVLNRLANFARELELGVLVETHSEVEVKTAVDIGAKLIGINARDLSTFETDRDLFAKLSHLIPEESIRVAESAVRNIEDVRKYRAEGADVVLVGETLVTGNAEQLLREFTSV
ncbi:MAG: indole-3-glycerol-phosphate synthase [Rhodoluna sp.]|nr:indole-3-glycerol-phosphate synthase [Rhodoluna sp.]